MLSVLLALSVFVRNYPAGQQFVSLDDSGSCCGVSTSVATARQDVATCYDVHLASAENPVRDRALVVRFCLPLEKPADFLHTHFPRTPVPIASRKRDYPAMQGWGDPDLGSSKMISAVPLVGAAAKGASEGLALGVAMRCPVVCRLGFDAAKNALYVECDLALAPEKPFADVRLVSFPFAAEDGFRGAWAQYMALHADDFRVRVPKQGTWLCMLPASEIPGWEDFGFTFMEHDDDVAGDDARGIYTFRYTSSSTWTINIPTNMPNDIVSAKRVAEARAAKGDKMAQAWRDCHFLNEQGEPACRFFDVHWLRGVSWNLNAEPDLPAAMTPYLAKGNSKDELDARYAGTFPQGTDGEFVDSASGYGVCTLDYNRSHYAHMKDAPLTFAHETGRVGIHKVSSTRAYIRKLSEEVHARGRLMMVNDCAALYHFIAPYADILSNEQTHITPTGAYKASKDHKMLQYRLLAGKKPFCVFQNADFTLLNVEYCERYMMRMLAYGILPSYFSPLGAAVGKGRTFFHNPEWRERVRPLFKKYFPTIRAVAEAGWEPVSRTLRSTAPDAVNVEQFGVPGAAKGCYVTVHNPSTKPVSAHLVPAHGFSAAAQYADAVTGEMVPVGKDFTLPAYATRVLDLCGTK